MPPKPKPENLFREVTAITELRRHTQPVVQLVPVNPYRSDSTDTTNTVRNESEQYFQAVANNQPSRVVQDIALDETPVHNDLILQRVVQTIGKLQLTREAFPYESSPSDVQHPPQQNASFIETLQWEVTGELDQANGQPRLSLHEVKLLRR